MEQKSTGSKPFIVIPLFNISVQALESLQRDSRLTLSLDRGKTSCDFTAAYVDRKPQGGNKLTVFGKLKEYKDARDLKARIWVRESDNQAFLAFRRNMLLAGQLQVA